MCPIKFIIILIKITAFLKSEYIRRTLRNFKLNSKYIIKNCDILFKIKLSKKNNENHLELDSFLVAKLLHKR